MISSVNSTNIAMSQVNLEMMKQRRGEMFNKMDSNQDGSISKAEMQSFMDQAPAKTGDSISIDELFSKIDTDKNGLISKAESDTFDKQMEANRQAEMKQRQDEIFSKMDTNQDGSISKAEMQAFMKQASSESDKSIDVDKMFSEMDTDGDGAISKAEADAFGEKMASNMPPPSPESMATSETTSNNSLLELLKALEEQSKEKQSTYQSSLNSDGSLLQANAQSIIDILS
jgi:Ca2+-binding EF-hand superfamily protein